MSDADYDAAELWALRRVAEAATPGSWDAVAMGSEGYDVRAPNLDSPIRRLRVARCGYEKWEIDRANADHIATFDPPTVLALLDEIELLRTRVTPPAEAEASHTEWRAVGDPGPDYPPYVYSFGDDEDEARGFVRLVTERGAPWRDGPHLESRAVTETPWTRVLPLAESGPGL